MKINKLNRDELPQRLQDIHTPPKQLFVTGASLDDLLSRKAVAIVGSRKLTSYGRQVTQQLAGRLADRGLLLSAA